MERNSLPLVLRFDDFIFGVQLVGATRRCRVNPNSNARYTLLCDIVPNRITIL
jgi:hypothetical protein